MIKNIIKSSLFLFALMLGVSSCNNSDDRVFDKKAIEREREQQEELKNLLLSSDEGWKLVYITDKAEFGGFTFLMKFSDDNTVEMVSDFDDDGYVKQTSEYEIQLRATTSLVFSTENKIHALSDPFNSPTTNNKGYRGEFQFRYYGYTDNEIIFRGTRDVEKEIRFVKATKEDWNTFDQRKQFVEVMNDVEKPYFRLLEVTEGGNTALYDVTFSGTTRLMTSSETIEGEDTFGVAYTENGLLIEPGIQLGDGTVAENFTYNASADEFVFSSGSNQVTLKYATEPANWTDESYKQLLTAPSDISIFVPVDGNVGQAMMYSSLLSIRAREEVENLGVNNLGEIRFTFTNNNSNVIRYTYKGSQYNFNFKTADGGTHLIITPTGWTSNNVPQEIKDFNDLLFEGGKLYVRREKTRIGYTNEVWTYIAPLTNMSIPSWMF